MSQGPRLSQSRGGCIAPSDFAKSLRCTLREIPDGILAKSRQTGATAGGLRTEASEQIFFVTASGPAGMPPFLIQVL